MFLRATTRKKDGKEHRYFSVVENKRLSGGRVLQRQVLLYLGEINSSQELGWRRSIEVLEERARAPRTLALFPEDRCEGLVADASIVPLRRSQLRLERPRQSLWPRISKGATKPAPAPLRALSEAPAARGGTLHRLLNRSSPRPPSPPRRTWRTARE